MAKYCPIQDQECRNDCALLAYPKNPAGQKCAFSAIARELKLTKGRLESLREEVAV